MHLVIYIENRQLCKVCIKTTKFYCDTCEMPLHPKECFARYHTILRPRSSDLSYEIYIKQSIINNSILHGATCKFPFEISIGISLDFLI